MLRLARTPSCCCIGWDGASQPNWSFRRTLRSCHCPQRCPELNPVENVLEFMHDNCSRIGSSLLRQYRRSLLLRLEHACQSALAHHDPRLTATGLMGSDHWGWCKRDLDSTLALE